MYGNLNIQWRNQFKTRLDNMYEEHIRNKA